MSSPAAPVAPAPATTPPADRPVHALIADQAAKTPAAVAVVGPDGMTLTYADLIAASGRLAARLRAEGVGPETRVALLIGRSPELLVAILGVLGAGGAYVPIDPAYPADRAGYILDDSGASLALVSARDPGPGRLAEGRARVLAVDPREGDPGGAAPPIEAKPDALAYVLYTSGSTGRPKGVMVPHRGLSNYLTWAAKAYRVADGVGSPVHSSVAFDLTVTGLFAPLLVGRRVEMLGDGVEALAEAFRRGGDYSLVKITPAHLRLLGQQVGPDHARGKARAFVVGGEALTPGHVAFWREHAPETRIVNEYGPTETVVGCSVAVVDDVNATAPDGTYPIGRAIARTRLHVLDARMEPVPVGVAGELYIGGAGVARGYLNRPGLTAERFVPDPFGPGVGGRLYRSGDLARRRADGSLEFLGRADDQVKVRGYRVELGEVEAAIGRVPGVRAAAAAIRGGTGEGESRLVGYAELDPTGPAIDPAGLRRALLEILPEPMVPSVFVVVDALPMTPNGKVDRAALPDPGHDREAIAATEYVAPRNDVESAVATAFAAVLGVERVGVLDRFFDLGGHSLMVAQVASRLRDSLGIEVPLRDLFELPTAAGLAGRIAELRAAGGAGLAVDPPIARRPEGSVPVLSFAQEALWAGGRAEAGSPAYNVSATTRMLGPLDPGVLARSLAELARRHEAIRTTFPEVDGRPIPEVAAPGPIPLPMVDLMAISDPNARLAEALAIAGREARAPFDLATGPLARATLIKLGDDDHALVLAMHHIVTDGWSLGVAVGELAAIYDAFRLGEPSPLAEPAIQYADYAAWQRERLVDGGRLDRLTSYWTSRLAGVPPLDLPGDRPRPPSRTSRGGMARLDLDAELTRAIHAACRSAGVTPFMLLLAGFEAILHRLSGAVDFAVGTPVANRGRAELEGLIGPFVNTVALRADLSGDPSFRALLARVRDEALGAFDHQELPTSLLLAALRPRRDPSRTPIFGAMFVLQSAPIPDARPGGLRYALLEPDGSAEADATAGTGTAKFDLTLDASERDGSVRLALEYSADLFDPATAARMLSQYRALLAAAIAAPDEPIGSLPLGESPALASPLDPSIDLDGLTEAELDAMLGALQTETPTDD